MKMGARETLLDYANRYWELYNEIGGENEKVAASTFMLGLPEDSELQDSLIKRPLENMQQLMRCIEEYKRLEDNQQQIKGKAVYEGSSIWGLPTKDKERIENSRSQCSS